MNSGRSSTLNHITPNVPRMSMGGRLQEALDRRGLTPPQLIAATKLSKGAVYNILNDDTKPEKVRADTIGKICGHLVISRDWLTWGRGSMESVAPAPIAPTETSPNHVRFPLLEGFAGMGRGDYVGDYPEVVDFVEVTREWASQKLHGIPENAIRVITGRGQSMRGTYNDGDLIFIDARIKQFQADAAYCYRWNGMVHIKRLQHIGQNRVRIISGNPDWPPIEVDMSELEIGGVALAAWTLREF